MSESTQKYLLFEVDEEYALSLDQVVEIIENTEITRVPETPDYIAGIVNLRGHVIPILDVRKRFRKPHRSDVRQRCIVIANIEEHQLGLLVDNVVDLIDIDAANIKETPQVGSNYIHVYIKNIGIAENKMYLIVDTDRLVNYNDLFFLEEKAEETPAPSPDEAS